MNNILFNFILYLSLLLFNSRIINGYSIPLNKIQRYYTINTPSYNKDITKYNAKHTLCKANNIEYVDNNNNNNLNTSNQESNQDNIIKLNLNTTNTSTNLLKQLSSKGQSGILAYGILNFFYYMIVTGIVWTYQSKNIIITNIASSTSLSNKVIETTLKLSKIMIIVWTGSQVTKIFRISGAIFLAPIVDQIITKCMKIFSIPTRNKAFWIIFTSLWMVIFTCFSILIFGSSVLEWMKTLQII